MSSRPDELEFFKVERPGAPLALAWNPAEGAGSYLVYATDNPFPPAMAKELFAGRMGAFVSEREVSGARFETDEASAFYAVVAKLEGDVWIAAERVRDAFHDSADQSLEHFELAPATQARTFVRGRWGATSAVKVELFVRDDRPSSRELTAMIRGEDTPSATFAGSCDGFVDTKTEPEWRKFYGAVAIDAQGGRRPLSLELGPFVHVRRAGYLEEPAAAERKLGELMDAVVRQLDVEVRARSSTRDGLEEKLARAKALYPAYRGLKRVEEAIEERFGE